MLDCGGGCFCYSRGVKKILIFSLAYYPSNVSGAEAAIREITDRIDPSDIEFHLITLFFDTNAPPEEQIGHVTVHRVGFGRSYLSKVLYIPLAVLAARSLHKTLHFDALWSVMTYMLFPVVVAKWFGVSVPHVLTLQDGDPYEKVFERWFILPFAPILNYGFKTAGAVQTISNYLATWPPKRGYRGVISVIPNGPDPGDIAEMFDPSEVEALKKTLGKKEEEIYLVNTARLTHQKAQDDVIRALTLLPKHISFLIVGGGNDRAMLETLAKELGVSNRVIFTGNVDRGQVTLYRKAADIFVAPSRSEGLGNAFLSAMASRLPVIATEVGGLADFIFDAKRNPNAVPTAWAVDPDSPEQIASAVKYILDNPDEVRTTVENARQMVLKKYDWNTIARDMRERVFAPVLQKRESVL
jgi:glycosyltransferase involved in cell wall biosynthesis